MEAHEEMSCNFNIALLAPMSLCIDLLFGPTKGLSWDRVPFANLIKPWELVQKAKLTFLMLHVLV